MTETIHDILILPDMHGRTFWKEAVKETAAYDKVVFLGDYLDPYPHEGITGEEALANFHQVLDFAQENENKVVMLLGNHDLHYVDEEYSWMARSSRYDSHRAKEFHRLFEDHRRLFSLAWETAWKGKRVLFTHAGVSQGWYKANEDVIGEMDSAHLNRLLETRQGIHALAQIGYERGGICKWGSIVWADVYEIAVNEPFPGLLQIFGHSQQRYKPLLGKNWACLDCRRAFSLAAIYG